MELIAFKLAIFVPLNAEGFILFSYFSSSPPPFFFNPKISNIAIVFIYICALVKIRFIGKIFFTRIESKIFNSPLINIFYFSPRFLTKLAKMIICRSIVIIAFPCINDKRRLHIYNIYIPFERKHRMYKQNSIVSMINQ